MEYNAKENIPVYVIIFILMEEQVLSVHEQNVDTRGYSYANLGSDTLYNDGLTIGECKFEDAEIENYSSDDDDIEQNIDLLREQSVVDHDYISSGGLLYWTPKVSNHIKPKIKSVYESYVDVVRMYRNYALEVGFDVRLKTFRTSTLHVITKRHLLCNREGKPNTGKVDALDIQHNKPKRRKDSFRVDGKAKIVLKIIPGTEKHVDDYTQESVIHNMSKQNIGATKAHRFFTGMTGCHSNRGLVSEFKNSTRNLNCFIGGRDSKFLVDKRNERKKYVPNFTFEYRVVDKKLNTLFWADEIAKFNYNAFRDVVSLDVTFNTNRYNMVFFPLTGIDNHKKCITFGAGMLSKEDSDSYSQLVKAFLKTFTKPPTLILSYQDPALLCMWHITKKLPKKAGWECLLRDFSITNNKWLNAMYGLRRLWIPTFFKDIPMSGLMRTTSLSEIQNWLFQNNTLSRLYLTNLERQRHNQIFNDFKTSNTFPKIIKHLPYEVHASKVYTGTILILLVAPTIDSMKVLMNRIRNFNLNIILSSSVLLICFMYASP
uniref:Protein FAR1-RELATED SEQUENCE n=1 Tax=Lactuca sativa TaxID=4236 RepID=A0A9R1XR81_LACSA|nr:hypothetical protein LSAT_V11C200080810 [Lactuca sativa]